MIKGLKKVVALSILFASAYSQAALITSSDVDISFTAPSGWTGMNAEALIDGNTSRFGASTERFVGLRNSGDALSGANSFDISVAFMSAQTLESISFFNDWGSVLGQQVMSMDITASGGGVDLGNWSLTGLATDSWSEISLVNGVSVAGVDTLSFAITGLDNINFEIREFAITVADSQAQSVSIPATIGFFAIAAAIMGFRKR